MSDKLPRITGEQLVRALERAGFERKRQKGSHVHLRRESDKRRVTVPVHQGADLPIGTAARDFARRGNQPSRFSEITLVIAARAIDS